MAIAFRAAATNAGTDNSVEVTLPSGSQADDIIIAIVGQTTNSGALLAHNWPSGWTKIHDVVNQDNINRQQRVSVGWRKFQSGDTTPTVSLPVTPSGGVWGSVALGYSGVNGTTPFAQSSLTALADASGATTSSTTATVTDSGSDLWAVAAFAFKNLDAPTCSFTSGATGTERSELNTVLAAWDITIAAYDSNGTVNASGGVSTTATSSATAYNWHKFIGLLQPSTGGGATPKHSCGILMG